jgi:type III secretion protein V
MAKRMRSKLGGIISSLFSGDVRAFFARYSDLGLAALVVLIVGMMIVPLPTFLLDLLISLNIGAGVILLLVAIYVGDALKIATFPSLLLLTTLFRLAIEVSATRLILLKANAGQVIHAFGSFVVSGNLVVGVVVFLILTTIQFIVIAKGSGRVAEVGARFTLDAMPGKQLSIDAELRTGHIDANEARRRRAMLARESQFFGAMDGAMKFVKGDAIAGIIILITNIVGGLAIGVLMKGMDLFAALRTYTLLTIGEGLVAQIPALVISTAAGVLVTRVSSEEEGGHLGSDIGRQILAQPKALAASATLLFVLALIPGLPALPFLVLGVLLGLIAYRLIRKRPARPSHATFTEAQEASSGVENPTHVPSPLLIPIAIDLSAELSKSLLAQQRTSRLVSELIPSLRETFFAETGIALPTVSVRDDIGDLAPGAYTIRLQEIPMAQGQALANAAAVANSPATPDKIIAEHLLRVLRQHGHMFVGIQETQDLARRPAAHPSPSCSRGCSPIGQPRPAGRCPATSGPRREFRCAIWSISSEALAGARAASGDAASLAEEVRSALRRQITFKYSNPDGSVGVFFLDSMIEETVREAIRKSGTGSHLALEPELSGDIVRAVKSAVAEVASPVILTDGDIPSPPAWDCSNQSSRRSPCSPIKN